MLHRHKAETDVLRVETRMRRRWSTEALRASSVKLPRVCKPVELNGLEPRDHYCSLLALCYYIIEKRYASLCDVISGTQWLLWHRYVQGRQTVLPWDNVRSLWVLKEEIWMLVLGCAIRANDSEIWLRMVIYACKFERGFSNFLGMNDRTRKGIFKISLVWLTTKHTL